MVQQDSTNVVNHCFFTSLIYSKHEYHLFGQEAVHPSHTIEIATSDDTTRSAYLVRPVDTLQRAAKSHVDYAHLDLTNFNQNELIIYRMNRYEAKHAIELVNQKSRLASADEAGNPSSCAIRVFQIRFLMTSR